MLYLIIPRHNYPVIISHSHPQLQMNYNEDPFSTNSSSTAAAPHQDQLKLHLKEQDLHLDHLQSSLQQVRHQTDAINVELKEHNDLLGRLGERMEETEGGFERAGRKVRALYGELTDRKFTWTASIMIFILTFLLVILLCT